MEYEINIKVDNALEAGELFNCLARFNHARTSTTRPLTDAEIAKAVRGSIKVQMPTTAAPVAEEVAEKTPPAVDEVPVLAIAVEPVPAVQRMSREDAAMFTDDTDGDTAAVVTALKQAEAALDPSTPLSDTEEAVKRKRRTKAEMEAARAMETAGGSAAEVLTIPLPTAEASIAPATTEASIAPATERAPATDEDLFSGMMEAERPVVVAATPTPSTVSVDRDALFKAFKDTMTQRGTNGIFWYREVMSRYKTKNAIELTTEQMQYVLSHVEEFGK